MAFAPPAIPAPKFSNVLFATDFSPCSQAALPYACAIAKHFEATLHVVHVFTQGEPIPVAAQAQGAGVNDQEAIARRALADLVDSRPVNEVRHFASIHRGAVPAVIARLISERDADLIVLGTHGRHGVKYFMVGSIAEQILRIGKCPVLAVGPGIHLREPASPSFGKILVATNFSASSMRAFSYAASVACAYKSTLVLFHAISGETTETEEESLAYLENATADATEQLYKMLPMNLPINCEVLIRHGSPTEITPAEMIVQTAAERKIDLVVMGAPCDDPAIYYAPWTTVHSVLCNAPCPVMTLRDAAD